jgi:hypothetical protein
MENNTAKHFVLQLGSLITLYLSISFLVVLLFSIINIIYPDVTEYYYQTESASYSIRLGIAMLLVFFPAYLYLTRKVNIARRAEEKSEYLGLTKWLMYLSLLVGGGVLLGDFVAIILGFLNGELTTRFILKAIVLMVVVGIAFYYYFNDARGYWLKRERESIYFAFGMTTIVAASIIAGFIYTDSPREVREMRLDTTQVDELRQIQWKIEGSLNVSSTTLPSTLGELYKDETVPSAPEGREDYSYEITDDGFKLCATFSRNSYDFDRGMEYKPYQDPTSPIVNSENWTYKEGRYCFERVVR